jgi:hypothetical protein
MAYDEEDDDFDPEETELPASTEPAPELPTGAISITLQLDQYLSSGTLENLIANNLAQQLAPEIKKIIRRQVEETILEAAKGQFSKHAEKMTQEFFEREFTKTDTWGQKTGEKVSPIEHFGKLFIQYMGQKVDDKGNESTYSGTVPRTVWIMQKLAIEPLNAAIKDQVGKVAAEAKQQITNSVSRYIADQLTPQIPSAPQLK